MPVTQILTMMKFLMRMTTVLTNLILNKKIEMMMVLEMYVTIVLMATILIRMMTTKTLLGMLVKLVKI